jgi:type IV pilus assembly protein PilV
MKRVPDSARARGFSLIEVMVAVIVICVGMLGIAKMQALSVSNTTTARLRSLAAIEAASIASAMHSNRQYWANTVVLPFNFTLNAGVVASSEAALATQTATDQATVPDNVCFGVQCTALQLAAFDVARWSTNLTGLLPNPTANIVCPATPGVAAPPSCTITISWNERSVAINQQETVALALPTYTLYVEP